MSGNSAIERLSLGLPADFSNLPPTVRELIVGDFHEGEDLMREVLLQVEEGGLSYEAAKQAVFPAQGNRGSSFYDVFKRAQDLPMVVTVGSAARGFEDSHGDFLQRFRMATALLGISGADGGGPGVMELNSRHTSKAIGVTSKLPWLRRDTLPEIFQVLLHAGKKECPNPWCPETHRVWPIRNLKKRTAMLFSLGSVLALLEGPGGGGTGEEHFRFLCAGQLAKIATSELKGLLPIIMLDFKMDDGGHFFDGHRIMHRNMLQCGTIKQADFDTLHYVDVQAPDSLSQVLKIIDGSFKGIFGYSLLTKWETENQRELVATVEALVSAAEVVDSAGVEALT